MKNKLFIGLFLLATVTITSILVTSCKTKKEREKVKMEFPNLKYVWVYKDDGTVAEEINTFGETKDYCFFNLVPGEHRYGWDQSLTGVLNSNKKMIMPPFYARMTMVWDPVSQERFFFGEWLSGTRRHVYDLSGNKVAEFDGNKWLRLKKLCQKITPGTAGIDTWEIKNFRKQF